MSVKFTSCVARNYVICESLTKMTSRTCISRHVSADVKAEREQQYRQIGVHKSITRRPIINCFLHRFVRDCGDNYYENDLTKATF